MYIRDDDRWVRPLDMCALSTARRSNYLTGGKDHFAVDRDSADRITRAWPGVRDAARAHRAAVHRMVAHAVGAHQVRQIVDIGCGLLDPPDVHHIAQQLAPSYHVVYVDHDPMVLVHARSLHAGHPAGRIDVLAGDLTRPESILHRPQVAAMLRRGPVLLLVCGVLPYLPDEQATASLTALTTRLPPASLIAVTHPSADLVPEDVRDRLADELTDPRHGRLWLRSRQEVQHLVDGLGLDPLPSRPDGGPALAPTVKWHPDRPPHPNVLDAAETGCYAWMGRRP